MVSRPTLANVRGARIETLDYGNGRPVLFLNAGLGIDPGAAALLSKQFRIVAPSHPGFGGSERPASLTTDDDLFYFYLDLLNEFGLRDVALVGIAAEMAVKSTARLASRHDGCGRDQSEWSRNARHRRYLCDDRRPVQCGGFLRTLHLVRDLSCALDCALQPQIWRAISRICASLRSSVSASKRACR